MHIAWDMEYDLISDISHTLEYHYFIKLEVSYLATL